MKTTRKSSPSTFTVSNAQPLLTSDSFSDGYYLDSGGVSNSGSSDGYGKQLSSGYTGSGYQKADSSAGRLSSGSKGSKSHSSGSMEKEADSSLKHSEGSIEAEKDRVVKHQWDRGGGYVKEWNWNKGVHYEKESGSVSASDVKHKESERARQSAEKSKGSAGWQQFKNADHEKWKASNGYGKKGHRDEGEKGYSDRYRTEDTSQGYNKIGSPALDPWSLKGDYLPLKAAASGQPYDQVRHTSYMKAPNGWMDNQRQRYQKRPNKNNWQEKKVQSLRDLIEEKYMPIYRKYALAAKSDRKEATRDSRPRKEKGRDFTDLRLALSKEFLGPQGRWKLGHLFGNGLDAFSTSNRFVWHLI